MENEDNFTVECPRCGSVEFAIEEEQTLAWWTVCRNCDWVMGEVTRKNLAVPAKKVS